MSFLIGELVLYLVLAAVIGVVIGFGLGRLTRRTPSTTVMFLEAEGPAMPSASSNEAPSETEPEIVAVDEVAEGLGSAGPTPAEPDTAIDLDTPDELTRINGVSPRFEQALRAMGYTTFASVAGWTRDDIRRVAAEIDLFPDRIVRDCWVEQSAALAAYPQDANGEDFGTGPAHDSSDGPAGHH